MKYYIDACIWRDYFENRSDNFRPLGDWAFRLIKRIIEEGGLFIIIDHLLRELLKYYSQEQLDNNLSIVPKEMIIWVESSKKYSQSAFEISRCLKIPFPDAVHAVMAKDNNAILVTRDKHFEGLNFIDAKKPEDLI